MGGSNERVYDIVSWYCLMVILDSIPRYAFNSEIKKEALRAYETRTELEPLVEDLDEKDRFDIVA